MASPASIMTQLKSDPIRLKENLLALCTDFNINVEPKDTRAMMQVKIDDFSRINGDNENRVKEQITKLKSAHKECLHSLTSAYKSPLKQPPNAQELNEGNADENTETRSSATQPHNSPQALHTQPPLFEEPPEGKEKRPYEIDTDDVENERKRSRPTNLAEMNNREILEALFRDKEEREIEQQEERKEKEFYRGLENRAKIPIIY